MSSTMRAASAGRSAGAQAAKKKKTAGRKAPPPAAVPKVKSKVRPPTKNESPTQRRKRQGVKKPAGSRF